MIGILEQAFAQIKAPLVLTRADGGVLLPADMVSASLAFPTGLLSQELVQENGYTWGYVPTMEIALRIEGAGGEALRWMEFALAILSGMENLEISRPDRSEVYRSILREEISFQEIEAVSKEYQIPLECDRCVILLHCLNTESGSVVDVLSDVSLDADTDMLLELDPYTAVLVKSVEDTGSLETIEELAKALDSTFVNDTPFQVTVSIGDIKHHLGQLGESFREARHALEVGRIYRPESRVYIYSRLLLERFLAEVPRETGYRFHQLMFNRRLARLFNDEMVHTIEKFFENNLNLSETARQLYIHRNTLVYRLDKVQRSIGLDLRSFDDAVTFKMLMLLGRAGLDKGRLY